jgi:tetratricopeptide (TPR) repeat protein
LKADDPETVRTIAQAYAYGYNYAQAQTYFHKLEDQGKATASDYNSMAWLSLYHGPVDEAAIHDAEQANLLTKSGSFAILHTLACLYAATGKSEQARQTLMQGMEAESLDEPNSSVWYAFAAIYEQYGLTDAAISAYKRVEKEQSIGIAESEDVYVLAQQRLKALGAKTM